MQLEDKELMVALEDISQFRSKMMSPERIRHACELIRTPTKDVHMRRSLCKLLSYWDDFGATMEVFFQQWHGGQLSPVEVMEFLLDVVENDEHEHETFSNVVLCMYALTSTVE